MSDASDARQERAARAWREAKSAREAWLRFRSWCTRQSSDDHDPPCRDYARTPFDLWTGPTARRLVVFQKRHFMEALFPDGRGSDWATRWGLATIVLGVVPRAFEVEVVRSHARLLGDVPIGYVGDLDAQSLHLFGALRSGDRDTPDVNGRHLVVEWLGVEDGWLHRRSARRSLASGMITMGWIEREYWGILKRFAPSARALVGDESFAVLESGYKLECEAFSDVVVESLRSALRRRLPAPARRTAPRRG